MSTFERGFKAWSERTALALRAELQLAAHAPLSAYALAQHLGIELVTPSDLPQLLPQDLHQLTCVDRFGWSAVSFTLEGATTVIYNSGNSRGRQSSDIMHEIAHSICEHEPSQIILSESAPLAMRSFNAKQEDEANWLGWTLLLPRPALMHCKAARMTVEQIAEHYAVSEQLVTFRRGVTGVDLQVRRYQNGRRR